MGTSEAAKAKAFATYHDKFRSLSPRLREELMRAGEALDALERLVALYSEQRSATQNDEAVEDLRAIVDRALAMARDVREAASEDVRDLVLFGLRDLDISTHALGRAAGVSNTTVARWGEQAKGPKPPLAVPDDLPERLM